MNGLFCLPPASKAGSRANPVTQRRRAVARDPPGDGDRTGGVRDRDPLDRRQDARGHRDNADCSGRVERLYTGS